LFSERKNGDSGLSGGGSHKCKKRVLLLHIKLALLMQAGSVGGSTLIPLLFVQQPRCSAPVCDCHPNRCVMQDRQWEARDERALIHANDKDDHVDGQK